MALETTTHRRGGFGRIDCELCEQMVYGGEVLDEEEMYRDTIRKYAGITSRQKEEEEIIINTDTIFRDAMWRRRAKNFRRRPSTRRRKTRADGNRSTKTRLHEENRTEEKGRGRTCGQRW